MNAIIFFAVLLLGITPILLVLMLAVRFAGKTPILNFVDYAAIKDPVQLHRRVGNILLMLPALSAASGTLALTLPDFAVTIITVFIVAFLGLIWFALLSAHNVTDSAPIQTAGLPREN